MPVEIADDERARLIASAQGVLRANDRGTYTVPSNKLYPYQWAWDSAFLAIGWATFDTERAVVELETLFSGQWSDGRVPHIHFWEKDDSYFPGPDVWGHEKSSTITNPAVFAIALEKVLAHACSEQRQSGETESALPQIAKARPRVVALLEAIEKFHVFLQQHRDPLGLDCVSCAHPWESGRDNCVVWDAALSEIDVGNIDASGRKDKDKVGDPKQRPTDDAYRGYLAIVSAIRESEYGPGPFAVYDPFLTTLLVLSEQALARIARSLGESDLAERASKRGQAVENGLVKHLWDEEQNAFVSVNAATRIRTAHPVLASLLPLRLNLPDNIREALVRSLEDSFERCALDFPTLSPVSKAFDSICYWRGPQWINMTWLFRPLEEERVDANILSLVREHGFFEYFDPMTRAPLGASNFGWSAALTLDVLAHRKFSSQ